jgi:hypothetical protein
MISPDDCHLGTRPWRAAGLEALADRAPLAALLHRDRLRVARIQPVNARRMALSGNRGVTRR